MCATTPLCAVWYISPGNSSGSYMHHLRHGNDRRRRRDDVTVNAISTRTRHAARAERSLLAIPNGKQASFGSDIHAGGVTHPYQSHIKAPTCYSKTKMNTCQARTIGRGVRMSSKWRHLPLLKAKSSRLIIASISKVATIFCTVKRLSGERRGRSAREGHRSTK